MSWNFPNQSPIIWKLSQTCAVKSRLSGTRFRGTSEQKIVLRSMLASGAEAAHVEVEGAGQLGENAGGGPNQGPLDKLEAKLSELRSRYGPGHPEVRKIQAENQQAKVEGTHRRPGERGNATPAGSSSRCEAGPRAAHPVIEAQLQSLDEDVKEQNKAVATAAGAHGIPHIEAGADPSLRAANRPSTAGLRHSKGAICKPAGQRGGRQDLPCVGGSPEGVNAL